MAGFTGIRQKLPEVLSSHSNFVRRLDCNEAGEWRFIFTAAEDPGHHITVHVFLFNLYVAP